MWCTYQPWWIAWLAAVSLASATALAEPAAVEGEMIATDEPALYRLPLVSSPTDVLAATDAAQPMRVAGRTPWSPLDESPAATASLPPSPPECIAPRPPAAVATLQLLPAVQRGYTLAQRGALFAARTEFIQVLRRVAQAQDAAAGTDEHAQALAAGLRALDESSDFVPEGIQLEAELNVQTVASSHRTPVLRECAGKVLPQEAAEMYHRFAEERLAHVAEGDQAGSMALYGLGKIYGQLAARNDADVQCIRSAVTMYGAALAARPDNHLAANELGVLMCRSGHAGEAARLFERAIDIAPSALAYHNLAVAQQKLGYHGEAVANEQEAQRLAALERSAGAVSRRAGIQWIPPAEMAQVSQPAALMPPAATSRKPPITEVNAPESPKSSWPTGLTRLLPRPGSGMATADTRAGADVQVAQPAMAPSETVRR